MNYIVIWWIITTTQIGCPLPQPDVYTGEQPLTLNAVACHVNHTEAKFKEFKTKEEALEFIKNAPEHIKSRMKLDELR